ncbi:MAG: ADP-ribosylation factor-like protein [Promethearchaeota archaeon]
MSELKKSSIFKCILLSVYDNFGPRPLYMFPKPVNESENLDDDNKQDEKLFTSFTLRDYTQISIKNLSFLIRDAIELKNDDTSHYDYFGIIPQPDYHCVALTYFHFIKLKNQEVRIPMTFSVLVDENQRNFIHENIEALKLLLKKFIQDLKEEMVGNFKAQDEVKGLFEIFIGKLIELEKISSPIISFNKRLKVLFVGLDDSGKTSFLLTLNKKFSRLMRIKPTKAAKIHSLTIMGSKIFLWDLAGQETLRVRYLDKDQIYLYESDLVFFFIDVRNRDRFNESIDYICKIKKSLKKFKQNTPIIYILSKTDPDIINSKEIIENVKKIKKRLLVDVEEKNPEIHLTSVFQPFTIMRAFSSGLAKLSPNKELLDHNLEIFSKKVGSYLTVIINSEGIIMGEFSSPKALSLTKINHKENLLSAFELTAAQFTILYQLFSKYNTLPQEETLFKVGNSNILFKKLEIKRFSLYALFLIDNEDKRKIINENIKNLINIVDNLVLKHFL